MGWGTEMGLTIRNPQWAAGGPIAGVLFDLDGVILDTEKLYARFWQEGAVSMGFPMTWEQALGMRSLNRAVGQAKLWEYFGNNADYHAIRQQRIALMEQYIERHGVELKPGIYPLMDALETRGIPAAIASSSPVERIQRYLSGTGLYKRFQAVCSGYQVLHGKPEPDIYLLAAQELGRSPRQCLALEDSPAGILSAYRAGCLPVMVPDLDQPDAQTLPRLYALADSLTDVISLLPRLN